MYKPGGAGNPQLILVGTLKDCMKLHKIIQNFPRDFGACKTVTWQLCALFLMKPAASWETVGCSVTCVTFTKLFYKVTNWKRVCKYKLILKVSFISMPMGCPVEWDTLRITDTDCVLNVPLTSQRTLKLQR